MTAEEAQRLMDAWNAGCGVLAKATDVNSRRLKTCGRLIEECGMDLDRAVLLTSKAARVVTQDEFWTREKMLGFDKLMPSMVLAKSEIWVARNAPRSRDVEIFRDSNGDSNGVRRAF